MTNLNDIISTFSSEDQQHFIGYLEKKNKRSDTKNIQLFKFLLKDTLNSKEICYKLYKKEKTNAYHALRKRLYQSLIDFIANTNLVEENSVDMQLIKYILASRTFFYHKQYKAAYNVLDKAEKLAETHFLFSLLNEIYHTKIQYAYTNPSIDINKLILKFNENQKNHLLQDQLNIVYAKIRQAINNRVYEGQTIDFDEVLNKTLQEHNISINDSMSFKSLYQLMTIVSISAFASKDYLHTEKFLVDTYNLLQTHKDNEKQLYYTIQVQYMIANTFFRNKKFEKSIIYLNYMINHMELKQKKYFKAFKLKYNLLLALNYNYLNKQDKAIALLEKFIISKHPDLESLLDIYLSLITFYFQKKEFKKAQSVFSKFYHTDKWYEEKAGIEWIIKKNLIEILLHIELHNVDLLESRLLSFKRRYYNYLKEINQQRVITYLSFVETYYKNPKIVTSQKFKELIENSFVWVEAQREDIFVMSFFAWLKSKMDGSDLHQTTLELIAINK